MNAYITSGTREFLEKITSQHDQHTFYFMKNPSSPKSIYIYYESQQKSVFKAARKYKVVASYGNLEQDYGYVVMNHITVIDKGKKSLLEKWMTDEQKIITNIQGLIAFRGLKPMKRHTFVVLTQWESKEAYEAWEEVASPDSLLHPNIRPPAYFANLPYTTSYIMPIDDDEDADEEEMIDEENEETSENDTTD